MSKMRRPLLITSPPKFKDKHIWEKIVNIVTCIPFALVGRKVAKRGKYSKLYNYSMCGTALAAGLYHTSEHPKVGTLEFLFFCCCFCALFSLTRLSSPGGTNQAFMCVCVCVCVCVYVFAASQPLEKTGLLYNCSICCGFYSCCKRT